MPKSRGLVRLETYTHSSQVIHYVSCDYNNYFTALSLCKKDSFPKPAQGNWQQKGPFLKHNSSFFKLILPKENGINWQHFSKKTYRPRVYHKQDRQNKIQKSPGSDNRQSLSSLWNVDTPASLSVLRLTAVRLTEKALYWRLAGWISGVLESKSERTGCRPRLGIQGRKK